MQAGLDFVARIGYPCHPAAQLHLGGTGGGIAYNREDLEEILGRGLDLSPVHEVLIEESVLGWKEFELEVMRDLADNVIIICSIENFDADGRPYGRLHHGGACADSHRPGIPDDARRRHRLPARNRRGHRRFERPVRHRSQDRTHGDHRDEPPRVAQSALASKATGFPIAKIAAKLAVGYRLDEIPNDITRKTPACFEPTIDYVVVKIPRWQFEKFPGAEPCSARR
jgi:carbamoyl-phosphate synthase large subunit